MGAERQTSFFLCWVKTGLEYLQIESRAKLHKLAHWKVQQVTLIAVRIFTVLKMKVEGLDEFLSEPVVEIIGINWAKVIMHSSSVWLVYIVSLYTVYNTCITCSYKHFVPLKLSENFLSVYRFMLHVLPGSSEERQPYPSHRNFPSFSS